MMNDEVWSGETENLKSKIVNPCPSGQAGVFDIQECRMKNDRTRAKL